MTKTDDDLAYATSFSASKLYYPYDSGDAMEGADCAGYDWFGVSSDAIRTAVPPPPTREVIISPNSFHAFSLFRYHCAQCRREFSLETCCKGMIVIEAQTFCHGCAIEKGHHVQRP